MTPFGVAYSLYSYLSAMLRSLPLLLTLLLTATPAAGQLSQTFQTVFDGFLEEGFQLSPGPHGQHFLPASEQASNALIPALNSLIASNVSSFPLSSTVAGVSFDFSTGQPQSITESLGPIFAEKAETMGPKKLIVGFNVTHLSLNRIRGLPLEDMRFTFFHEDLGAAGLGDNLNESDIVDISLGLDVDANIFALSATYGLTQNLDIGFALPIINVDMSGEAQAVVQSFTLGAIGEANHHFGNDARNPDLVTTTSYSEGATGLGDLALRLKYRLMLGDEVDTALLADIRLPTGDEEDFLGTGDVSARFLFIASKKYSDFTPHINLGYDYRGADFDSDELEIALGFDQKVATGVSFAFEFLGEFALQSDETIDLLPGTQLIVDQSPSTGATSRRVIQRSNVPDNDYDHRLNAAVGFRIAPSENIQLLGNLLIPLQDGGLRSSVAPTIGASILF